jgi:hypothetical protein
VDRYTHVRRFRSDDPPDITDEELARELIPRYWIAAPRTLAKSSGAHRWIWDLHYPAPTSTIRGFPISAVPYRTPREPEGPIALPGNYIVRLTVDGNRSQQALVIKPDPRVRASAESLQQQFELASELAELLTDSSKALLAAQSQKKQIQEIRATGAAEQALKAFDAKLSALLSAATTEEPQSQVKPEVKVLLTESQGQLDALYKDVTRGDGAPTAAELSAAKAVRGRVTAVLQQWQQLQSELPDLNKTLRAARLPAVRTDTAPPRDLNVADEE